MKTDRTRPNVRRLAPMAVLLGTSLGYLMAWYRSPSTPWREKPDEASNSLRRYLPNAEFSGEVSVKIAAPPQAIYAAQQSVTLNDMPIANWLGQLRYLPGKLMGKDQEVTTPVTDPFLNLVQTAGGNIILSERPGEEIVLGAVGKFHNLVDQQFVPLLSPADFVAFDQPDYQKLIMSFKVTPLDDGATHRLTLVHGTHALSSAARAKFALYWLGIKPGGNFVSWLMLRAIKRIAEHSTTAERIS